MNVTKADLKALEAVRDLLPSGPDLQKMPVEDREKIYQFDAALLRLHKKGREITEKTRVYMNEKRALDPCFGRGRKYKEDREKKAGLRASRKIEARAMCEYFKMEDKTK